jgi:hypothetical protein
LGGFVGSKDYFLKIKRDNLFKTVEGRVRELQMDTFTVKKDQVPV